MTIRSLNGSQPNLNIYSLMTAIWKICSEFPQAFTPYELRAKNVGTDFELWPNISLQQNMISTIGKKLLNLRGLPYMRSKFGELWPRFWALVITGNNVRKYQRTKPRITVKTAPTIISMTVVDGCSFFFNLPGISVKAHIFRHRYG